MHHLQKKHFLIAIFFALIGIFRFNSLTLETYYFSPIIFILLVKISNLIFTKLYDEMESADDRINIENQFKHIQYFALL